MWNMQTVCCYRELMESTPCGPCTVDCLLVLRAGGKYSMWTMQTVCCYRELVESTPCGPCRLFAVTESWWKVLHVDHVLQTVCQYRELVESTSCGPCRLFAVTESWQKVLYVDHVGCLLLQRAGGKYSMWTMKTVCCYRELVESTLCESCRLFVNSQSWWKVLHVDHVDFL